MDFINFFGNPYPEIEDPEKEEDWNELIMMVTFPSNQLKFNYRPDYFDKLSLKVFIDRFHLSKDVVRFSL